MFPQIIRRNCLMDIDKERVISKVSVCLEVGPQATGAFVPDCPGCWVFAQTKERALQKARIAVVEWFKWLSKHGEKVPRLGRDFQAGVKHKIEIAEMLQVNYNPAKAGKPEPLFWSEVLPVKKNDIKRTIRLMGYSRKDLLNVVSNLTRKQLSFKPANEPRTIRNCLRHIAYVEWWYINRLNIEMPEKFPKDVFGLSNHIRELVVGTLQKLPREKMRGVHQPAKYKSPTCDLWTARKVLRRLVDHERLHTKYIERLPKKYTATGTI
jgi:predicted RNase H-like HicB family nuclease